MVSINTNSTNSKARLLLRGREAQVWRKTWGDYTMWGHVSLKWMLALGVILLWSNLSMYQKFFTLFFFSFVFPKAFTPLFRKNLQPHHLSILWSHDHLRLSLTCVCVTDKAAPGLPFTREHESIREHETVLPLPESFPLWGERGQIKGMKKPSSLAWHSETTH